MALVQSQEYPSLFVILPPVLLPPWMAAPLAHRELGWASPWPLHVFHVSPSLNFAGFGFGGMVQHGVTFLTLCNQIYVVKSHVG